MRRLETEKNCKNCEKEFVSWIRKNRKFCSHGCYWEAMKNNPEYYPTNIQDLIDYSNTTKGRKNISNRNKGMTPWNKGKKMPEISGENHYLWIEDRSKLQRYGDDNLDRRSSIYNNWRQQVRLRDNFTCRIINKDCRGRLETHHILGWKSNPELRYEVNNGITLCAFHHPRKRKDEKRLVSVFNKLVIIEK